MSGIDQGMMPEHVRPQRPDDDTVDERVAEPRTDDERADEAGADDERADAGHAEDGDQSRETSRPMPPVDPPSPSDERRSQRNP